jgi:hypothetical protein
VNIVDVAEGRNVRQLLTDGPTVVTSAGGMTLVRATDSWRGRHDRSTVDLKLDGSGQVDVPIGGYDLFNHYFAIRRAPVQQSYPEGPGRFAGAATQLDAEGERVVINLGDDGRLELEAVYCD